MSTMFEEKIVIFFDGGDKRAAADAGWQPAYLAGRKVRRKKCIRGGRHRCMALRT